MELDEIKEVYQDVNDLHDKVFKFVRGLVVICREFNYISNSSHMGVIKLNGFKNIIKPSAIDVGTKFVIKYKKETLMSFRFFIKKFEDKKAEVRIYEGDYYLDLNNIGLIKEFAAEIKKNIEVINISMGEII